MITLHYTTLHYKNLYDKLHIWNGERDWCCCVHNKNDEPQWADRGNMWCAVTPEDVASVT